MAMKNIDSSARIEDGAVIGEGTTIGPYCVVGANVTIGANCKLVAHVHVAGHTTIGDDCTIYPFASLGAPPQILNLNESGKLRIGAGCTIREYVTMNSGSPKGGGLTTVGARGYFMNCAHVGHDCHVGNDVIFATSATLGGHCDVGDFVFMGGLSAAHQFTRIGPQVMVGGVCGIRGDIIPFGLVNGQYAALEGLNIIGMKRRAFTRERIMTVRGFYQKLFHGNGVFAERLATLAPMASEDPAIAEILAFIGGGKHRALCMPADSTAA
ncbi:MAG: acyl-[acyl-carrier-protein]--UDP-N-acetylglucosamine O-acyltransferase [Tardiphaga sp.]|nr:acyl-[acyl-carrier-protein]--UDP-N-acetylglucosamine O-acyltransferase [Tardiphaga sp.]